jgi:hypothetical protein
VRALTEEEMPPLKPKTDSIKCLSCLVIPESIDLTPPYFNIFKNFYDPLCI